MRRLIAVAGCTLLLVSAVMAQDAKPSAPKLAQFDPALVDKTKDPCTDFFQYACSKWIAQNPIPADMPMSSTALPLYLWNQTVLRTALEKAAANKQATGTDRQIGDYWQSCSNEDNRDNNGKSWLAADLKTIDTLKDKKDIARVLAFVHKSYYGAWQGDDNSTKAPLFGFGPTQDYANSQLMVASIDQGGYALPSREYYLKDDEASKKLRDSYLKHIQHMFEMAGDAPKDAAAEATVVLSIEAEFAKASMVNVDRREPEKTYNKRTLAQIKQAAPTFDWDQYFALLKAPKPQFYIVSEPKFLPVLDQQLKTRSVQDWKAYLRWWAIHNSAGALGKDFQQANFDFFRKELLGVPQNLPLWRRCVNSIDNALGEAVGQAYVREAFPGTSKDKANDLVNEIRKALSANINQLEWMQPATKKQAQEKLAAMLQKIGYPDKWRDYSTVKITSENYLANIHAAADFEFQRQLKKIGQPVDRYEWGMTPPTINAYEDPQMNTINFPAGILQMPFFSGSQDDALNYGAIGSIIGHEIIHGFDDQGRKFDAKGNLRDWWTETDAKNYDQRDKCIVDQYTTEIPQFGVKQNGQLTAGEDTADNGGLHLSMMALEDKYKQLGKSLDTPDADGFTARQRFFLSYAFAWCGELRPEMAKMQVTTNPHSLDFLRVNRPVSNSPEFQKAFGCKAGQPMVHTPACRVW